MLVSMTRLYGSSLSSLRGQWSIEKLSIFHNKTANFSPGVVKGLNFRVRRSSKMLSNDIVKKFTDEKFAFSHLVLVTV